MAPGRRAAVVVPAPYRPGGVGGKGVIRRPQIPPQAMNVPNETIDQEARPFGASSAARAGGWLMWSAFALLAYPAWVHGGTSPRWQWPIWWLSGALSVWIVLGPALLAPGRRFMETLRSTVRAIVRDPVFYGGLGLVALLTVQWWNAGRELVFDPTRRLWGYSNPPVAWLPSAFTRGEAREMLVWFMPAGVLMLAVRSPAMRRKDLCRLLTLMAVNAALVGAVGFVRFGVYPRDMYAPNQIHGILAHFGYPNHAGSFFALMFCLSIGLLLRALFRDGDLRFGWEAGVLAGAALLSFTGVHLSLSRAAILMAWGAGGLAGIYVFLRFWPRLRSVSRLNLAAGVAAVLCLGWSLAGSHVLGSAFGELRTVPGAVTDVGERLAMTRSALAVWRDHPWFGTGGWGFRYLVSFYVSPDRRTVIAEAGHANVHNDPVQFLSEFGAVGAGLIAVAVAAAFAPALKRRLWNCPLPLFATVGLGLVAVHSLVDLPFRCPAVLYSWAAMLAAVGIMCRPPSGPANGRARRGEARLRMRVERGPRETSMTSENAI